jgi:hypothetical protein
MDVHCTTCGEPWDTHHLWQDAIWETGLEEAESKKWLALSKEEKLSQRYRDEFKSVGYVFGQTLLLVIRCPGCPADAKPDPALLYAKSEMESMLGDDEDGLASEFETLGV